METATTPLVDAPARDYRHGEYVEYGDDSSLHVRFYIHPVTEEAHIRIELPNDPYQIADRAVEEFDKIRFSTQWRAFESGSSQTEGGIDLNTVSWVDEGTIKELAKINCFTVQQVSGLSDDVLLRIYQVVPGLRDLRARALKHLEQVQQSKAAEKTLATLEDLQKKMDRLERENKKLKKAIGEGKAEMPFS